MTTEEQTADAITNNKTVSNSKNSRLSSEMIEAQIKAFLEQGGTVNKIESGVTSETSKVKTEWVRKISRD